MVLKRQIVTVGAVKLIVNILGHYFTIVSLHLLKLSQKKKKKKKKKKKERKKEKKKKKKKR